MGFFDPMVLPITLWLRLLRGLLFVFDIDGMGTPELRSLILELPASLWLGKLGKLCTA
jgi:hypothetical protein